MDEIPGDDLWKPLHTLYLQKIITPVDGQGTC